MVTDFVREIENGAASGAAAPAFGLCERSGSAARSRRTIT
jgi:hypothetical protein